MELRAHHVPVDGGHLYVEEAGDGPSVLLVHAGVTDRRVWNQAMLALTEEYWAIRYDVRGYGQSPRPTAPFSLVSDAVAVLDHFKIDTVHLVGLSQGAATSVDVALADPDRVRSLTLVAPGLSGYSWPSLPEHAKRLAAAKRSDVPSFVASLIRLWAPLSVDPDGTVVDDLAARMVADNGELLLLNELEQPEPSALERLEEIDAPTLILVGDRDVPAIADIADLLAKGIRGSRKLVLSGADHLLPMRVPNELHGLLLDHLADADAQFLAAQRR